MSIIAALIIAWALDTCTTRIVKAIDALREEVEAHE
jgi:hypothetical protein